VQHRGWKVAALSVATIVGVSPAAAADGEEADPDVKTLTWTSTRASAEAVRQSYEQGGHFRCKASNATFAKTTRRGIAMAKYKETDVRAEDAYSFWW
jgi:hypothetical protein